MRVTILIVTLIVLAGSAFGLSGFCTGVYLEKGDYFTPGLVQEGDVFEYWCELPTAVESGDELEIQLVYTNANILDAFLIPRPLFGGSVVIFP